MNLDKEMELLAVCSSHYNTEGMSGLEKFIKNYSGITEETDFLNNLRNLIATLNSNGRTRVMCLSYSSVGQIIEHGICFAHGFDSKLQDKIEEYQIIFSNIPRRQS